MNHINMLSSRSRIIAGRALARPIARTFTTESQDSAVIVRDDVDANGKQTGIKIVELNRPKKLNALTTEMGLEFLTTMGKLAALSPDDLKAVVLTGSGNAFSAGGDLEFLLDRSQTDPFSNGLIMEQFYRFYLSIRQLPVPIIGAINGHAIGAGLCLATATDMRVVAEDAKLGMTFVGLGLHPGMGATHFLPRMVSPQVANYMLLTGDVISGKKAQSMGLALEALPKEDVLPAAISIARSIANQGSIAVRTCLQSLRQPLDSELTQAMTREAAAQAKCYASEDLRKRVSDLQQKTSSSKKRSE